MLSVKNEDPWISLPVISVISLPMISRYPLMLVICSKIAGCLFITDESVIYPHHLHKADHCCLSHWRAMA